MVWKGGNDHTVWFYHIDWNERGNYLSFLFTKGKNTPMKKIRNILIIIGVIFFANYIIHLPMCVKDYANKDFGIYSTQTMHKHSTLTMSTVLKLVSESTLKFYISPRKADFIFDYTNNFYAIINIPVYLWQFARANINPCVLFHWICGKYDKNKCSNAYFLLSRHIL